ncbi:MAG: HNH endonuclease [Spirosomaceae bacterium]|nr:HNH endonuclease [Spirosomataceae bacterium]
MSRRVLVLNADYSAISLCTVPKAFLLVYLDKAELIASSDGNMLRTVNTNYPMPSVIRLNKYVSVPYKGVVLTRQNIFKRDNNSCCYCGSKKDLTLDHVMPKSRGGKTSWTNLATACRRCNTKKGNSTPEEAQMPLSVKPFRPTFIMFLREFDKSSEAKWLPYLSKKSSY